ncbi:hypothetical protein KAI56_03785 [Candidatus Parcubacteria bacterium]|nr:hypothetical protein [Candidatus Parcubacteria bacterium]
MDKRIVIFLLIFIVGSLAGIVGYSNAKITTFEECENAGWLVRSIKVYDYVGDYGSIEKECTLWTGKNFVKQRVQEEENSPKTQCCEECKTAFNKSPVGFEPEIAMCGKFNSGQPINENCELFFENNPMSVSACKSYLDIKRAIEIATAHLSFPTTVVEVEKLECYGCFSITLQRDDNQHQFTTTLNDWKITN